MFIGREKELKNLNSLYDTDKFQFPVIYGRRRVGKTALINEFVKDKDTIYFTGIETTAKQNLENFSRSIFNILKNK
ncbi:ATP-binding protein, partial [Candidatus Nomurabacteria bacterium]|nr:ATP-binding protein [Candidatus Nomurabacteria bacterium]